MDSYSPSLNDAVRHENTAEPATFATAAALSAAMPAATPAPRDTRALSGDALLALPLADLAREKPKMRPGKAWHHFQELLKDKERTEEVFYIFEALPWAGFMDAAERYSDSAEGRAAMRDEPYLPALLDDHAALRRFPAGSVAHAYCDFMEKEGLTAAGLVEEFDRFREGRPVYIDKFDWYSNRNRDTHDLLHVLTGYGRDALGEACVLAFTYSQSPSLAHLFIGYMAGLNIKKQVKSKAPVLRAIREGQRLGKACPRVSELPIRELLAMPLDEARKSLNITPARHYAEVHRMWKEGGINPYDMLGNGPATGDAKLATA